MVERRKRPMHSKVGNRRECYFTNHHQLLLLLLLLMLLLLLLLPMLFWN